MSNLLILSENERENFDNPPALPAEIKTLCFTMTPELEEKIKYVAKLLGIALSEIDMAKYQKTVPAKHQLIILELLGYKPFNETVIPWLAK